eukprot:scaffold48787_cov89-Cyclotella_meneghiniana.AAC.2
MAQQWHNKAQQGTTRYNKAQKAQQGTTRHNNQRNRRDIFFARLPQGPHPPVRTHTTKHHHRSPLTTHHTRTTTHTYRVHTQTAS